MTQNDFLHHLIVIKNLERVVEDGLNNPDLPTGIGDVAARVSTHQRGTIVTLAAIARSDRSTSSHTRSRWPGCPRSCDSRCNAPAPCAGAAVLLVNAFLSPHCEN